MEDYPVTSNKRKSKRVAIDFFNQGVKHLELL